MTHRQGAKPASWQQRTPVGTGVSNSSPPTAHVEPLEVERGKRWAVEGHTDPVMVMEWQLGLAQPDLLGLGTKSLHSQDLCPSWQSRVVSHTAGIVLCYAKNLDILQRRQGVSRRSQAGE